jgi:predicted nucleic acid-binding protein
MKVFVDTNILLDVLTEREPFYKNSAIIWTMAEKNVFNAYISAISVNNVYYITRKLKGRTQAGQIVDKILEDFTIIALTYETLKLSRTIEGKDFEDVIQYFSAGCPGRRPTTAALPMGLDNHKYSAALAPFCAVPPPGNR